MKKLLLPLILACLLPVLAGGQTTIEKATVIRDGTNAARKATVSVGGAILTDGSATTQPVSGTFWQATQPVSGTFWQATQPVSIVSVPSHAVTNAGTFAVQVTSAPSTTVTNAGTFATQAAQSGTWTVQPGNTANTTAWKVDGSAVTQPVSVASIPSHAVTNAGTFATQASITTLGAAAPASAVPVVQATATTVVSTALEASHVGKASAGSLVSLHVFNTKTSAQYILIMNSTTVPADGAVTLLYPPIYVPATSNVSLVFMTPLVASTGISVSNSSTGTFTKTIGSADCIFTIQVQ